MMKRIPLSGFVSGYFFSPISPLTLSIARIIIFGLLFWKSLSRAWFLIPDWPASFLIRSDVATLPYVTTAGLASVTAALAVFSLLGAIGVLTRLSAVVCFAALYLLNAVDGGAWDRGWVSFSFVLLMTCSRSSDALRPPGLPSRPPPAPSWEFRWPLRVIQLTMVLVYLEAGLGKILKSGLAWPQPDVLAGWYYFHLWTDTHYHEFGVLLLEHPWLASLSQVATLVIEIGVILVVFVDRLKWIFVPSLLLMHLVIGLTLNIWFTEYFFLLLLFFDWSRLPSTIRRVGGRPTGGQRPKPL